MSVCTASPASLPRVWGNPETLYLALVFLGMLFAMTILLSMWKMSRDLQSVQLQLGQLTENIHMSNTPVIISEPAVFF